MPESRPGFDTEAFDAGAAATLLWLEYRRTRDSALREQLVLQYSPLVVTIADQIHRRLPCEDRDDLVSSGMVGLLAAVDRYDPGRCVPFMAYARPRVRGAILDALRTIDFVPHSARRRGESVRILSLDVPEAGTGADQLRAPSLAETIADEHARDPEEAVVAQEEHEVVRTAVEALPERERQIVVLHDFGGVPATQLAEMAGVTPGRIVQIYARAIAHLRQFLQELGFDGGDGATVAPSSEVLAETDALTDAELEVLRAAAEGMSAGETAKQLTKSTETVKSQRRTLLSKLEARNMAHAVWVACQQGYLEPAA